MRRSSHAHLVVLSLLIIPLGRAAQPDDPGELMSILRAVHADLCAARLTDHRRVISDRPFHPVLTEKALRELDQSDPQWIPLAEAKTLWPRGQVCPGLRVVDHLILERLVIERDALPRDPDAFARRFHGARSYESISLPAYSADGMRLIVYVQHLCPLCGSGTRYELTRSSDGWKITRVEPLWES